VNGVKQLEQQADMAAAQTPKQLPQSVNNTSISTQCTS